MAINILHKYAVLSRPTLTCVDTPVYDIGAVSMRLLTKYMLEETLDEIINYNKSISR